MWSTNAIQKRIKTNEGNAYMYAKPLSEANTMSGVSREVATLPDLTWKAVQVPSLRCQLGTGKELCALPCLSMGGLVDRQMDTK